MKDQGSAEVFVAKGADRDLLHAAALSSGLRSMDLSGHPSPPPTAHTPSLIATDQVSGSWEPGHARSSSQYDSPMFLQARGQELPYVSPSPPHSAPAFVLHSPLRLESAASAFRQATALMKSFVERHGSMISDLDHCRRTFDSASNGVTVCDATLPELPLTYVNPTFERTTGYTASEVYGRNCSFLQGTDTLQPAIAQIRESLRNGTDLCVLLRNYRKDGTLFWNELYLCTIRDHNGRTTHFVGIQNDVTRQVQAAEHLQFLAHHDPLTGLANRTFLMGQLNYALQRADRSHGTVAILHFDLNKFKEVNDALGQAGGDQLLLSVAARLRSATRSSETVARVGGDEFVVVLEDITADSQPAKAMRRLTERLEETTNILGTHIRPCASVGMAIYPQDGDTAEALLKSADSRRCIAKRDSRAMPKHQQSPGQQPASSQPEPALRPGL